MRQKVEPYSAMAETLAGLGRDGLLLVTGETGNPMTIGWGTVGPIWNRPVFTILVRPSRHSFTLLEELPEFTVSVPTEQHSKALSICGTKSGRDVDKMDACWFTPAVSSDIAVPYITECPIHYECRVIHRNDLPNAELDPRIIENTYPRGDFHRVFYGEILGVYREG